jgi:uncharacterized protein involved in exopolysaccharide biosynthesis
MPKLGVVGTTRPRRERRQLAEFPNAVEGQVAEICRDLAVQAKRMQQLQEQANELRTVIRRWAAQFGADSHCEPTHRGERR